MEAINYKEITRDDLTDVGYTDDDLIIVETARELSRQNVTRVNMNLLTICIAGKAQFELNGSCIELTANQVVVCPPNTAISNLLVSPEFEFRAIFFTNRILQGFLREKISVWNDMMYVRHVHVWTMDDRDSAYFGHFYEMLRLCMAEPTDLPYSTDIIQSLLRSAFLGLCGRFRRQYPAPPSPVSSYAAENLFQRFLELLYSSKPKHRTVESYASELCITPKYLSAICKKNSGKTASRWISENVQEDIRYYLRHTDHSMKQVCDLMGFPNPSFFGRYVKEHFGVTPLQLRNQGYQGTVK